MASETYSSGSQPALFVGPSEPDLKTPLWIDSSVTPHRLNLWLPEPHGKYLVLGSIDTAAETFTASA